MEMMAPQVVAVVVTCDPGAWFEEALEALAAQDYEELSVLVLDAGSAEDPTARVASVLPGAYVRLLGINQGFGASANEALTMVEGASHFLFCHDDVAPDPDVVHLLVEESFRSNAGVVAPKLVAWDDPGRLLHVGMAVDKGGAVVDRVEPGEIDQGQHDAVRDVFLAPGGCMLVRADLFAEIGGFDAEIFAMGEDLDLCWRAQVAGARVVVAPAARVRHFERLASGKRGLPEPSRFERGPVLPGFDESHPDEAPDATPNSKTAVGAVAVGVAGGVAGGVAEGVGASRGGVGRVAGERRRHGGRFRHGPHRRVPKVTLQSLQRRHELHAALKCYGRFHLLRVVPQLVVLAAAEYTIALVSGHHDRASAVSHAWRWNLARRRALRAERAAVQATRRLDDAEVRRLQLHGSARLTAYVRRAFTSGLDAAHRGADADVVDGSVDERNGDSRQSRATSFRTRAAVWGVVAVVLLVGTRQLLGGGLPYLGQLLPLPSLGALAHRFVAGWQPTGVGTTDPTSPATALLAALSAILGGSVGLAQKVVVLGCIPAGAIGMARLGRHFGSTWARAASTLVYLAVPVAYDALATGRVDALLVYAAAPWVFARLARAAALVPFGVTARGLPDPSVAGRGQGWRRTLAGQALCLGALEALVIAGAPAAAAVWAVMAVGLVAGIAVVGGRRALTAAGRVLVVAVGATALAAALLAPWSVALLRGPARWQALTGVAVAPTSAPHWTALLRLALGPIGDTPLAWAFLAAAALPLVIGARWRLAWAGRAWMVTVVAWAAAWAGGRGWLGAFAVPSAMLMAPAAVGLAVAVGLGVRAFEMDLAEHHFGWRQGAAAVAALAVVVGALPVLGASLNGRWDLPVSGFGQATSWMGARAYGADFRVLWLGDPRSLPGNGWQVSPGLGYLLSEDGVPDAGAQWAGSAPGPAAAVGAAVALTERSDTVRLGQLLAPFAVRYVVVVDTLAPSIPGYQTPVGYPPPPSLLPALQSQIDLHEVVGQAGFTVFANDSALPERSELAGLATALSVGTEAQGAAGTSVAWRPVLRGGPAATSVTGFVPAGAVLLDVAPAQAWQMVERGGPKVRSGTALGFAPEFGVFRPGTVTVSVKSSWAHVAEVSGEIVAWLVVAGAVAGRRAWLDWWWVPARRRRRRRRMGDPALSEARAGELVGSGATATGGTP